MSCRSTTSWPSSTRRFRPRRLQADSVFGIAGWRQAGWRAHEEGWGFIAEADHATIVIVLAAAHGLNAAHGQRRATRRALGLDPFGTGRAFGLDARRLAAFGTTITAAAFTAGWTLAVGALGAFRTRGAFGLDLGLLGDGLFDPRLASTIT
jgi:hypothetical protein